jgi:hypothetical protein
VQLMLIGIPSTESASSAQLVKPSMLLALPACVHRPSPSRPKTPAAWPVPHLTTGTPPPRYASPVLTTTTTITSRSSAKCASRGSSMTPSCSSATVPMISLISTSLAVASAVLLPPFGIKPLKPAFSARVPWSTMSGSTTAHALTVLHWLLMASAKNAQAAVLSGTERSAWPARKEASQIVQVRPASSVRKA